MAKLKFIVLNKKNLVLRFSENGSRYYKSVTSILVGNPNIEKHWNPKKECFTGYASYSSENNKILSELKTSYLDIIAKYPELSAKQICQFHNSLRKKENKKIKEAISQAKAREQQLRIEDVDNSVEKFLQVVIQREKAKSGCNYELYVKLLNKCRKLIIGFSHLTFDMIDYDKCVSLASIFAQHDGYWHTTKVFRALLGKASDEKKIDFDLSQIGKFKFAHYNPDINEVKSKKPDVLSPEQLKTFLNFKVYDLTPSYKDRETVGLYHDFCVFMFHTFFSPCDVIKLKYKDITKHNTIHVKRKKTHKPVEIPINPVMENIINKYRGKTKNGYVFPIMDDEKAKKYKTKDFIFKRFREKVNIWLKPVGEILGTDYNLYAYVFRHTAITVALDNGTPISFVAAAAGTSIEMIQKHYYNGDAGENMEKLKRIFLKAAM